MLFIIREEFMEDWRYGTMPTTITARNATEEEIEQYNNRENT